MRLAGSGLYVVAAVVVIEDLEAARRVARSLLVRRQPKFHWRNESEERRRRMLDAMRELGIDGRVYVREPIAPRRQVGARALCVNALLWDLAGRRRRIDFESRQALTNAVDRSTILLRSAPAAPPRACATGSSGPEKSRSCGWLMRWPERPRRTSPRERTTSMRSRASSLAPTVGP